MQVCCQLFGLKVFFWTRVSHCEKDLLEINNEFPVSELVRNIIEQMQLQSICMTIVRVDKCDHKQMWIAVQYIVHSFYEKERNVLLYVEVKSIKLK